MPARRLGVAQPFLQPRRLEMGSPGPFDGEARVEIVLRFAPQSLPGAQASQRQQQRRIPGLVLEPALGALDASDRVAPLALGVQADEFAVPARLERVLDDAVSPVAATQRDEA